MPVDPSSPQSQNPNRQIIRRVVIAIICIVGAAVFMFIIYILSLVITAPVAIPIFTLKSASLSPLKISTAHLSFSSNLTFSVKKAKYKLWFDYDLLNVSLFHGSDLLSTASVPPFFQNFRKMTIQARLVADGVHVREDVSQNLARQLGSRDASVAFRVRVVARVKYGQIPPTHHFVRAFCEDVRIGFGSSTGSGAMLGKGGMMCESAFCDSHLKASAACFKANATCFKVIANATCLNAIFSRD